MTFESFTKILGCVVLLSVLCGLIVWKQLNPLAIGAWLDVPTTGKRYLNRAMLAISCLLLPISVVWIAWTAALNWWLSNYTPQAILPYFMLSFLLIPPPLAYLMYRTLARYGDRQRGLK